LQCLRVAFISAKHNGEQSKMYDENELFATALGLNIPYQVKKVEFNLEEGVLHIHIHFPRGSEFSCPVCGNPYKVRDTKAHQWRHLNFFELKTYLHANVPRIDCPRCGVKTVKLPWSRKEGINSLVQPVKAKARGYRNPRSLKVIIPKIAGKLDFGLHV
jgi:transposase